MDTLTAREQMLVDDFEDRFGILENQGPPEFWIEPGNELALTHEDADYDGYASTLERVTDSPVNIEMDAEVRNRSLVAVHSNAGTYYYKPENVERAVSLLGLEALSPDVVSIQPGDHHPYPMLVSDPDSRMLVMVPPFVTRN